MYNYSMMPLNDSHFEEDAKNTFEGNVATISKLLPYLEKYQITLAIENIYGGGDSYLDCHISKAEDIMKYIEYFNHPLIGTCIDTGHTVCTKCNTLEMARTYGKHLLGGDKGREA